MHTNGSGDSLTHSEAALAFILIFGEQINLSL